MVDDSLYAGWVALFTFGTDGASFDSVRLQEAAWKGYCRFDKGPIVPVGYRMRVLASSDSSGPAEFPNVHDRFVAGPGETGDLHFAGSTCDLRIVDPKG